MVCGNCSIRVQYSYTLRLDIVDGNEHLLSEDGLRLTKLESTDDDTAVYKIVDLDDKASCAPKNEKKTQSIEFVSLTDQGVDIEFLDADTVTEGYDTLSYVAAEDSELAEYEVGDGESDSQPKPDGASRSRDNIEADDNQDAVSFLLGNSHILDQMSESVKNRAPRGQRRPHSCKVCSKTFLRKSNLIDHLRLHANLRLYQCEHCDKAFVQAGNFKSHLRIHTKERPFSCKMCSKTYNQSSALKVSLILVQQLGSAIDSRSIFSTSTQVHIRSHTNERNYKCDQCEKAFTNSSDLSKHKRVHDPNQKMKCEYCPKTFAQRVNWKSHMKKHHPDVHVEERK